MTKCLKKEADSSAYKFCRPIPNNVQTFNICSLLLMQ